MNARRVIGVLIAGFMVWSIGSACAQTDAGANAAAAAGGVAASPAATRLDPAAVQANLQNLQQKAIVINRFADKFQAEAATQFGTGFNAMDWKRDFGSRLIYQPLESLSAALHAPNLSTIQNALIKPSGRMVAQHATDNHWAVNFLATPCRIVDTRSGGGGVLGPAYRFWLASTATAANIAAQGGNAAGCGNFPNADGFLLYVTVVPTLQGGPNFLTVQHDASPAVPTSSTMNYYGQNIANFAITACNGCSGFDGGFFAFASGNSPNVVVDLLAWTGTLGPTALECQDVVNTGTIPASGVLFLSSAACPAGWTRTTGGACQHSANYNEVLLSKTGNVVANANPNSSGFGAAACAYDNLTASSHTAWTAITCCRVPGL